MLRGLGGIARTGLTVTFHVPVVGTVSVVSVTVGFIWTTFLAVFRGSGWHDGRSQSSAAEAAQGRPSKRCGRSSICPSSFLGALLIAAWFPASSSLSRPSLGNGSRTSWFKDAVW
jgi:hypothetical protein